MKKEDKLESIEYFKWEILRLKRELKKKKKYGLVWEEKPEDVVEMCKENLPILNEVNDNEIITNSKKPMNILIEGDNYHALSVLNYTHEKKIDLIYIDPPYNTGNKDFIFNDRYVEREDSYKHSKWLSFMYKRLLIAKKLLKQDGIIFISIDDNELSQLKIVCDEIFGENNFIANIIWQKVYSPKNQSKRISIEHEYILIYAKKIELVDFSLLPRTDKMNSRYKNPDNDKRGPWQSGDLIANEERKNGHFIINGPKGSEFDAPPGKHWAYNKENLEKLIEDNRIWFGNTKNLFRD